MENVKLLSNKIWLSEEEEKDYLTVKVLVCDFSVNGNGVQLDRSTIDSWLDTIQNMPIVGRLKAKSNGEIDFTSHNATIVKRVDESGVEYDAVELNTEALGTFTSVGIEQIDGVECIVASCRVWTRFFDASNLIKKRIKEGTISTSWEIAVDKASKKIVSGSLVKVIHSGRFIGLALLGQAVEPAYKISHVLEVASTDNDVEICSAILSDVLSMNENPQGNEVEEKMENETLDTSEEEVNTGCVELGEEEGKEAPAQPEAESAEGEKQEKEVEPESEPEKAELTLWDLRKKVEIAICHKLDVCWLDMIWLFPVAAKVWAHKYDDDEMNLNEFSYTVHDDDVTVSDPVLVTLTVSPREINSALSAKSDTIIDLNNKINELSATVESLSPYKEAAEQAAREKAEAQRQEAIASLRKYAEESGMVSKEELDSGEIAEMIESLNETGIKVLIADRIVEKSKKSKPAPETASQKQPKVRMILNDNPICDKPVDIFKAWVDRK